MPESERKSAGKEFFPTHHGERQGPQALSPLGDVGGRVLWWIGFVLVEWAFLYFLYRKRTFLRI